MCSFWSGCPHTFAPGQDILQAVPCYFPISVILCCVHVGYTQTPDNLYEQFTAPQGTPLLLRATIADCCWLLQGLANVWGPLDDVVMGGVSESGFKVQAGAGEGGQPAGIFSGTVSSSNNGGFASVRLAAACFSETGCVSNRAGILLLACVGTHCLQMTVGLLLQC